MSIYSCRGRNQLKNKIILWIFALFIFIAPAFAETAVTGWSGFSDWTGAGANSWYGTILNYSQFGLNNVTILNITFDTTANTPNPTHYRAYRDGNTAYIDSTALSYVGATVIFSIQPNLTSTDADLSIMFSNPSSAWTWQYKSASAVNLVFFPFNQKCGWNNGAGGCRIDEYYPIKSIGYQNWTIPVFPPNVNGNIISTIPNSTTIYQINNDARTTAFKATANITRDNVNVTLYIDGLKNESKLAKNSTIYELNFSNYVLGLGVHKFNFTLVHENGTNVTSALYSVNISKLNMWTLEVGEKNGSIINLEQLAGENKNNTNQLYLWNETQQNIVRRINLTSKIVPILNAGCLCNGCSLVANKCYIPFYFSSFSNGSIFYKNLSVIPKNTTFFVNLTSPANAATFPIEADPINITLSIFIHNATNLMNLTTIRIFVHNATGHLVNSTNYLISGNTTALNTTFEVPLGIYTTYSWNATATGVDYDNNVTTMTSTTKTFLTSNGLYSTNMPTCIATLINVTCTGVATNTSFFLDTNLNVFFIDFMFNQSTITASSNTYGRINTTKNINGRNINYTNSASAGSAGTPTTYTVARGNCAYGPYVGGTGGTGGNAYFLMLSNSTTLTNLTIISNAGNGGSGGSSTCGFCDYGGTECQANGGNGAIGGNISLVIKSTNNLFIDGFTLSSNVGTSGSGAIGRAECADRSSYNCVGVGGSGANENNGTFLIQSVNGIVTLNNIKSIDASNGDRGGAGAGQKVGSYSTSSNGAPGTYINTSAIFSAYNLSMFSSSSGTLNFGNGVGFSSGNGYFLNFFVNQTLEFNGINTFGNTWSTYNSTNIIRFSNPLISKLRWFNTTLSNPFYIFYNSSTISYFNDSTFNRGFVKLDDKSVNLLMGATDYWGLDEISGTNVSNINNSVRYGTATDTTITAGKIANARSFQAATDKVTINGAPITSNNQEKTISMWVKNLTFPVASANKSALFSTSQNFTFGIQKTNSTSCALYVSYNGANDIMANSTGFACSIFADWNHVAMTYDGINTHNGLKLYLNGQDMGININENREFFALGGTNYIGLGAYASIDEVGVWSRWLNSEEIKKLYYYGNALPYPYIEGDLIIAKIFQDPADITSTNILGRGLNVSFNITATNSSIATLNGSSPYLNYTMETSRGAWLYVNGTRSFSGYTRNKATISNITSNYFFRLQDNEVLPGTYNVNETLMETVQHTRFNLGNQWLGIELLNMTNTTPYNFFEIMTNATSTLSASLPLYACNSSHRDITAPSSDTANCLNYYSFANTFNYSHIHTNNSAHQVAPFTINTTTGLLNNQLGVTEKMTFWAKGPSNTNSWWIYNISYASRNGATKIGTNIGTSYVNMSSSPDAHAHQFGNLDTLKYQVCAISTLGNLTCSYMFADIIGLATLVPTAPYVYLPNSTQKTGAFSINYTAALSPSGATILFYNITLVDVNNETPVLDITNNSNNLGYLWNSTNFTAQNIQYKIKVEAKDSNGLTSFGLSTNFSLNNPADFWVNIGSRTGNHWFPLKADFNWRGNFTGYSTTINFTEKINTILANNCSCIGCKLSNYSCQIPVSFESNFRNMSIEYSAINITANSNVNATNIFPSNDSDWWIGELNYFKCAANSRNVLRLNNVTFMIYNSTGLFNKTIIATNGTSNTTTYAKVISSIGNYSWGCVFQAVDYDNNQTHGSSTNSTFEVKSSQVYDFNMTYNIGITRIRFYTNKTGSYTQYEINPVGQTNASGIFVALNNNTFNGTVIAKINETYVNGTARIVVKTLNKPNYSNSIILNNEFVNIFNFTQNTSTNIWLWEDYINITNTTPYRPGPRIIYRMTRS